MPGRAKFFNVYLSDESFRQFDHGDDNMMVYNASEPPEYDMSMVTVPTTFMYAASDQLTVPEVFH